MITPAKYSRFFGAILLLVQAAPSFATQRLSSDQLPPSGRPGRQQWIFPKLNPGDVGMEIGVDAGEFTVDTLLPSQPSKLYLVDPHIYKFAVRFSALPHVEIIKGCSWDVCHLFKDGMFDWIYVDGAHGFEPVRRDLHDYFPKVKVGGLILGDDWGWEGVANAIISFAQAHPGQIQDLGTGPGGQWGFKKLCDHSLDFRGRKPEEVHSSTILGNVVHYRGIFGQRERAYCEYRGFQISSAALDRATGISVCYDKEGGVLDGHLEDDEGMILETITSSYILGELRHHLHLWK